VEKSSFNWYLSWNCGEAASIFEVRCMLRGGREVRICHDRHSCACTQKAKVMMYLLQLPVIGSCYCNWQWSDWSVIGQHEVTPSLHQVTYS